ncbi:MULTISPECIES: ice-binding family protein [unclassified Yoonia]|uniref:ice-binding family protein n=1 Tax=unclassified Yoonia TaxID=2629118 RepID=UPI002AFF9FDC|nr:MULTISPECIES: ice-binding family protein [unclassified Yoonia]
MAQDLQSFAIVSGQSVTNTGATTITGNIAISPGISYTGSGTVTQDGAVFLADAVAVRIQNDLVTLYTFLTGRPTSAGGNLSGQNLAGMVLSPGVYNFDSSANLASNGVLTLDAGGNEDAVFILNIGSTLIAESGSEVQLINGARGGNVFYRVGSSATLGDDAKLQGQIVALTSISMNADAQVACGAALARNGSVTLIENTIQICTLTVPDLAEVAANPTLPPSQQAVAVALSEFIGTGGVLPIGLAIIAATQTPEELAISLSQLSGEVSTGLAPMGLQSMGGFLDVVMGRGQRPSVQTIAPRDEGVPAGMVPDKINAPYLPGKFNAADTSVTPQPMAFSAMLAEQTTPWNVWAAAYGSRNIIDGDSGLGVRERTSDTRGIAVGMNYALQTNLDLGVALSWNTADFALDNDAGTGTSDAIFAALRARSSTVSGYVEGAVAYGRHDLTTDRNVTIAGFDQLRGETEANHFAAHVEAGYHMGIFTPFVGLRAQSFRTDAYAETATTGVDTYALSYAAHTTHSLRSELGVDMQWAREDISGRATTLGLRAAWAHEFRNDDPALGSLVTTPALNFPASGATRDSDSLLLSASVGSTAATGLFVEGGVNMEYSQNAQDLGGSVTIGYRW